MRLLVTGAAGFIGSHLAERLAALGHDVVGLDLFPDDEAASQRTRHAAQLGEQGVTVLPVDLAEDDLTAALDGADGIFHLAAQTGLWASKDDAYRRNNVLATQRLVDAARALPSLTAFVHASTSSVYGALATGQETTPPRPASVYGQTKLEAEQIVRAADGGMPTCILRLYSVYGPRDRPDKLVSRLLRALDAGTPFPLYAGSETHRRSYTYVEDAVEGLVRALDRIDACRGETINLGHPVQVSTGEAIDLLQELAGRRIAIETVAARPGDQMSTQAHTDKAQALLGYQPATSLRDGLAAVVRAHAARELVNP